MTDFPNPWAEMAWKEGHRPLHLSKNMTEQETKLNATRRKRAGETAEKLRELAAQGYWITEAAKIAGVSTSTVQNLAKKHGIQFERGHKSRSRDD